jgi:predicted amidophosphoribosyltransferase
MVFAYRAICPACSRPLSSLHFWFLIGRQRCEHCLVGIRSKRSRENWQGYPIVAVLFASIGLALFGIVPWWNVAGVVAAIVVLGWITFPMLTTYDRLTEGPQCLRCGYDLKGVESPICPECGNEHDAKSAAM